MSLRSRCVDVPSIETLRAVITGYNSDIEHNGVVYHVQTEDKGLQTPIILSLVYTGGAILASKRSPYDDLIASGFDQNVLAERLQRQHRLICAAIHAGRIEDLKQMSERAEVAPPAPAKASQAGEQPAKHDEATEVRKRRGSAKTPEDAERFSIRGETEEPLVVNLVDEGQLRAGESVTLRVEVTKRGKRHRVPAAKANITVKVLGSTFQPSSTYSTTDKTGRSAISVSLPIFKSGRAALLIRAEADGEVAEVRRVIHPA